MEKDKIITPESVLEKQELIWDESVEMTNEKSLIAWPHAIKAMKQYHAIKLSEFKESINPKCNIWGADIKENDKFFDKITRNAGPRD